MGYKEHIAKTLHRKKTDVERGCKMQMTTEAREARNEYQRQWREKNRDKVREYQRQWRKAHPEKVRETNNRYWAKKAKEAKDNGEKE